MFDYLVQLLRLLMYKGKMFRLLVFCFLLCSCATSPNKKSEVSPYERHQLAKLLMKHPKISESTLYLWLNQRYQPYTVYRRFSKSKYSKVCGKSYDETKGRYFRVRYRSLDGLFVEAIVAFPKNFSPSKKYSAIIRNRGNYGENRRFNPCYINSFEKWTSKNYILFAPQYRGVLGGEGKDHWGGDDRYDVVSMTKIVSELDFVDAKNIFMLGQSRGGGMAFLALKEGAKVNAVAVLCPQVNILAGKGQGVDINDFYPGISEEEKVVKLKERSVVFWPEKINTPTLMLVGAADTSTPAAEVKKLSAALSKRGVENKTVIYPKTTHCMNGAPTSYVDEVSRWFDKFNR
ncbi:MAG: prolyl oligopeptidase family serine peptidase [Pseudomonadota bacterium]